MKHYSLALLVEYYLLHTFQTNANAAADTAAGCPVGGDSV